ncbi:hypothetical protein BC826DRAFT_640340 [Russula brevipes]|nr:hypothetical protein BC826DRAFT_640340 [Russula brevipes]
MRGRADGCWARWRRLAAGWKRSSCGWRASQMRCVLGRSPAPAAQLLFCICVPGMSLIVGPPARLRFRSPCTCCTSRSVRCYLTYGRSAPFVYGRCGRPARLSKRTTRRGWRCGRDRHRDRRCAVSSSPRALVGNSIAGSGCASTRTRSRRSTDPFSFSFSSSSVP